MNNSVEKMTEKECRKLFVKLIYKLAEKDCVDEDEVYFSLEKLYFQNKFRHYYSDIFSVLTDIKRESTEGNLEYLGLNIRNIYENYHIWRENKQRECDISESIKKFYDHVNLDLARIAYSDSVDYEYTLNKQINEVNARIYELSSLVNTTKKEVEDFDNASRKRYDKIAEDFQAAIKQANKEIVETHQSIDKINKDYEELRDNIDHSTKSIYHTRKKVEKSEKEYIAILGIFAAVVITFVGGIAFSTSVLQNIHQSSIYRIVFICLLIGLVLLNVICALFYFIERLVKNSDDEGKSRNSIKPFIVINSVMLVLILITFACWRFGCVEHRNNSVSAVTVSDSATPSEYN